jgi:serine/threonine protein kinase
MYVILSICSDSRSSCRDLKSQNILLDDRMRTKIADFGLSKFREVGKTMSICGSPLWVAPEVLRGEKYSTPCDVYSFSIIVWEVLAWSEPYPNMGSTEVMKGIYIYIYIYISNLWLFVSLFRSVEEKSGQ